MTGVSIVDYGGSNLSSVVRAFAHCGAMVRIVDDAKSVLQADRLVLPGVGAFGDCQKSLKERGLWQAILEFNRAERPFFGICVGMQLMMDASDEFGNHEGLGLIPGRVSAIPSLGADGQAHKIPHIGWNRLTPPNGNAGRWQGTILDCVEPGSSVYFVHSFAASPQDEAHKLANTDYDGCPISAVIRHGNAYGCQFHTEKSGPVGLGIINNFLRE